MCGGMGCVRVRWEVCVCGGMGHVRVRWEVCVWMGHVRRVR